MVVVERQMRDFPFALGVEVFIKNQVKVIAFTRVEAKPYIGNHGVISAVVLDECACRKF